jgi:phospholipase/carboxylesterase
MERPVMSFLVGPYRAPKSGGPAKQLIIFLHGVGADGNDLISFADYYAELLPDADFLAPDAPFPCDMAPQGRQWFSLQDRAPAAMLAGAAESAPILNGFIDDALSQRGLSDAQLALVGFSQGTMMALHVGLRRAFPCAAVVGYSGLLVAPENLPTELHARPPVLLVHGDADETVPVAFQSVAQQALELMGVAHRVLTLQGLGHSINDDGLIAGLRFVAEAFGAIP